MKIANYLLGNNYDSIITNRVIISIENREIIFYSFIFVIVITNYYVNCLNNSLLKKKKDFKYISQYVNL